MSWLLGLGLVAAPGGLVVFGALTGRLAAIIAAAVKPADLGAPGQQFSGGAENAGQASTFESLDEIQVLQQQAQAWGLTSNAKWKAKYDATVRPLVVKATQTNKQSDISAAVAAYTALNNEFNPTGPNSPAGTPQTPKAIAGKSSDPTAGQAPEVAPPVTTTS